MLQAVVPATLCVTYIGYVSGLLYSDVIQCTILGDVFCSIHDVNVHVNNDVLIQMHCRVFIKIVYYAGHF